MPSIFDFAGSDAANSRMRVIQGSLPPYIDAAQPPTKKSPWRQIKELPFVHTFTMLMPDEMYQMIWNKLDAEVKTMKYAKVIMKLQEVLDGDFFTEYIKKGMPALLSERSTCSSDLFLVDVVSCFLSVAWLHLLTSALESPVNRSTLCARHSCR
jgi:ribonuclease P/MRP protein subunit RPP40